MLPSWLRGNAPTADQLIMEAIIKDTEKMGGDKSCQIDVGIQPCGLTPARAIWYTLCQILPN